MYHPATHFAPEPGRLPHHAPNDAPTMLSVTALAGVPALVRQAFGEKVLRQANRAALLDIEQIEDRDCFIPHATMTRFLAEIERRTGEPHLGLMLAPRLSLASYGWTDRNAGIAHIPVDRAMAILAERGWPDPVEPAP